MGRRRKVVVAGVLLAMVAVLVPTSIVGADGIQTAWFEHASRNTSNGGWIDAVTVGDLDNDNRNDVVVTTGYGGGNTEVFYQAPNGTLRAPVVVGSSGTMVRVAEVTNDSFDDLVMFTPSGLIVRSQLPDQTLAAPVAVPIANATGLGEVGDYDGDGRTDVVVIRSDNSVAVLLQQTDGTLAAPVLLATYPAPPKQVVLEHVDGDSRLDVAVAHGESTIAIRSQQGDGTLAPSTDVASPSGIRDFVLGDFNDDTYVDVATSHGHHGNGYVIYRNADLSWGAPVGLTEPGDSVYYTSVRTGDLDLDGKLDLVTVKSHNDALVYLQGPDGLHTQPVRPGHSVLQWPGIQNGWVADINGDGHDDILSAAYYGALSISYNTTGTTVTGILGQVTDTQGAPAPVLKVEAVDDDGNTVATTFTQGAARYWFSWRDLDPGSAYRLRFSDTIGTRPTVWYRTGGVTVDPELATPLSYTLGSTTVADLVYPYYGSVTGRVVDGHADPVPGLEVSLTPVGGANQIVTGTTDANGEFDLDPVFDGDYSVSISDPDGAFQSEWWGAPGRPQVGTAPTVTTAQPLTDLGQHTIGAAGCSTSTLAPGADLDGLELTGCWLDGAALPGASLVGTDLAGSHLVGADLSGADLTDADVSRSDLFAARLGGTTRAGLAYADTTCPDGTNSDLNADTCDGHLENPSGTDLPAGELWNVTTSPSTHVVGWAYDPNTVDPATVRITVDGIDAIEVVADLDAGYAFPIHPRYGTARSFDADLGHLAPGVHEVCASVRNVGPGSDVELGCQVVESAVVDARYTALPPQRILDTRIGTGTGGATAPVGPDGFIDLDVTGVAGVPADHVGSVVLNVTATDATEASFLTVWPTLTSRPVASNLNFVPWQTVPNLVVAKVGANGQVRIGNVHGNVHVVADIAGYFDDGTVGGGAYHPSNPVRVLDTRIGTGGTTGPLGPGEAAHVQVGGNHGVPLGSTSAVVLNVTVTDTTEPSYLTVFPSGTDRPLASNLNFVGGETSANLVVVKVSPEGWVDLANTFGDVHVVADLAGWFDSGAVPGSTFNPLTPARILDTRIGTGSPIQPIGEGGTIHVRATGVGGVPEGATAVVLNLTATNPSAMTFLTVFPAGTARPVASNLNVMPWQTRPNLVVARVSPDGWIDIFNAAGTTDVVADVAGWFG